MSTETLSPMERVLTTLGHKEPDRVPFFLLLTMHGARELGMSIKEYFSSGENVAEGQIRMQRRYRHDCYYSFFYAPVEVEAWGGEVVYTDNGPPNSGSPVLKSIDEIGDMAVPDPYETACLRKVLDATRILKQESQGEIPIIGVVMSPFSLPVMQLGFDKYLDLMYEDQDRFHQLMEINRGFTVAWANAQLEAGATAICFFDPVSSTTVIPRELYLETGHQIATETISQIQGPTATHMASGRCLPIIDDIATTGTAVVGVSADEDLSEVRRACGSRLSVLGNLNGIEMRRWDAAESERQVRSTIKKAGGGGGFILSDNHGEIPWQVPETVLDSVSTAVHAWGRYPLASDT